MTEPEVRSMPGYFDVAALLAGELPPAPAPKFGLRDDGVPIFYAEQVNLVFGDPEGGKTWVCLWCAATELMSNPQARVLVLDLDHNGAAATVTRLLNLGVPKEVLADLNRFRYIEPEDNREVRDIVEDMADWQPTIVLVDSLGELLPMFGSSSNSADDFTLVHTRVLKPLARTGAAVLLVDHLAKGSDSRTFGPGGTGAKRRAIGGVSLRVRVENAFTPGKGGSAFLSVNKDRHGGLRRHCPTGDREPLAGIFKLHAFADEVLEATIAAPKDGERAPADFAIGAADPQRLETDVAALSELDPKPRSQRDVIERMKWGGSRAAEALRAWRSAQGVGTPNAGGKVLAFPGGDPDAG